MRKLYTIFFSFMLLIPAYAQGETPATGEKTAPEKQEESETPAAADDEKATEKEKTTELQELIVKGENAWF